VAKLLSCVEGIKGSKRNKIIGEGARKKELEMD